MTNAAEVEQGKVVGWQSKLGPGGQWADDPMASDEAFRAKSIEAGAQFRPLVLASDYAALVAERDALRAKLFPYADETQISGMSWGGFYLIGDDKSIKELKRVTHRSGQLEQFSAAYEESVGRERARALTAESALTTATAERDANGLEAHQLRTERDVARREAANWLRLHDEQDARADAATAQVAALREALEPFAEAADGTDANDDYSSASIWEHSCALDITIGNLRKARRALKEITP